MLRRKLSFTRSWKKCLRTRATSATSDSVSESLTRSTASASLRLGDCSSIARSTRSRYKPAASGFAIGGFLLVAVRAIDHERRVVAAKAERVRDRHLDLNLARRVGDVVEVALRVGLIQVDRGREHATVQGQHAGRGLDRAGRAEQVAVHRLGGADGELLRVRTEH